MKLSDLTPEDQEFRDYGNNPLNLLATMNVNLTSSGWPTSASIKVIEGKRPSIIGRDLMAELGLHVITEGTAEARDGNTR